MKLKKQQHQRSLCVKSGTFLLLYLEGMSHPELIRPFTPISILLSNVKAMQEKRTILNSHAQGMFKVTKASNDACEF